MSLNEVKNENNVYKDYIDNINAEKLALDQLYVESIKSNLSVKKELIFLDNRYKNLQSDHEKLLEENKSLKKELEDLKSKKADKELEVILDNAS